MPRTPQRSLSRLDPDTLERCAAALRVLAHPQRLMLVELLMDQQLTVGELAAAIDLAPAAVSQHLNQMKLHGLLDSQRQGKAVYYRVCNPHAVNVIRCIREHGQGV